MSAFLLKTTIIKQIGAIPLQIKASRLTSLMRPESGRPIQPEVEHTLAMHPPSLTFCCATKSASTCVRKCRMKKKIWCDAMTNIPEVSMWFNQCGISITEEFGISEQILLCELILKREYIAIWMIIIIWCNITGNYHIQSIEYLNVMSCNVI